MTTQIRLIKILTISEIQTLCVCVCSCLGLCVYAYMHTHAQNSLENCQNGRNAFLLHINHIVQTKYKQNNMKGFPYPPFPASMDHKKKGFSTIE